jgi:hypothetical protein
MSFSDKYENFKTLKSNHISLEPIPEDAEPNVRIRIKYNSSAPENFRLKRFSTPKFKFPTD